MKLPPLFQFDGNWSIYLERIYRAYVDEIVNGRLVYDGLPIRCRYKPPIEGKGFGFWHIIQEGDIEEERLPDLRRCERIGWIPHVIREAGRDSDISVWEEVRGTETDVLIWCEEDNYLIVLSKRRDYLLLKTAYCPKPHKVKTLRKSRSASEKGRKG